MRRLSTVRRAKLQSNSVGDACYGQRSLLDDGVLGDAKLR